jgi:hypothetical protein
MPRHISIMRPMLTARVIPILAKKIAPTATRYSFFSMSALAAPTALDCLYLDQLNRRVCRAELAGELKGFLMNERRKLKWSESFLDGSFASAKEEVRKAGTRGGAVRRSGFWRPHCKE